MSLILVTGGVRSGKSRFAEKLAHDQGERILYVATGIPFDEEMKQRVALHQVRRPSQWGLAESPYRLDTMLAQAEKYDAILLDCLSNWISNRLIEVPEERIRDSQVAQQIGDDLRAWLASVRDLPVPVIVVTNEVGLGGVAMSRLGRWFQDMLGESNQLVANQADQVYAVMSGISWRIKG